MTAEAFCPEHGPYDASLGACPFCSGSAERPAAPMPLDEDDLPTDIGYGEGAGPTGLPGMDEGEGPTEIPDSQRGGGGYLDLEEDETELPRSSREDLTELGPEVAPRVTLGMLWVTEGPRRGRYYPIKDGTIVGRKEGDLILDDPKVSGSHAKFTIEDDQFLVWDFGSSNGTHVNGKRIRQATALEENDSIKIGDTTFVVKLLDARPKRRVTRAASKSSSSKRSSKRSSGNKGAKT